MYLNFLFSLSFSLSLSSSFSLCLRQGLHRLMITSDPRLHGHSLYVTTKQVLLLLFDIKSINRFAVDMTCQYKSLHNTAIHEKGKKKNHRCWSLLFVTVSVCVPASSSTMHSCVSVVLEVHV